MVLLSHACFGVSERNKKQKSFLTLFYAHIETIFQAFVLLFLVSKPSTYGLHSWVPRVQQ